MFVTVTEFSANFIVNIVCQLLARYTKGEIQLLPISNSGGFSEWPDNSKPCSKQFSIDPKVHQDRVCM